MRAIALVAGREFTERLRSRTFLISNAVIILLLLGSLVLPMLLQDDGPTRLGYVGDGSQRVAELALAQQETFESELELVPLADEAVAITAIDAGEVDAVLLAPDTVLVERSLAPPLEALIANAANGLELDARLSAAGLDPAERAELFAIDPVTVRSRTDDGGVIDPFSPPVMVAFVGVFLLYGLLVIYGQWVAQGIVEEKQSRVVELLLATVRPTELLIGKVLGLGLLGLAQVVLLVAAGVAGLAITDAVELPRSGYGALGLVIAWYVLGYLLYATLFAMAGAVVARVEDLQSAVMPVIVVLVLALMGAQAAIGDPTSTFATVAGLVPFTAPIVQPVLAASDSVSIAEMTGAAVLAVATIAVMLPLCGRIYRGGVLATRGRISFKRAWGASRTRSRREPASRPS